MRQGEKGSYEVMRLGRWERRKEIPNDKYQNLKVLNNTAIRITNTVLLGI